MSVIGVIVVRGDPGQRHPAAEALVVGRLGPIKQPPSRISPRSSASAMSTPGKPYAMRIESVEPQLGQGGSIVAVVIGCIVEAERDSLPVVIARGRQHRRARERLPGGP